MILLINLEEAGVKGYYADKNGRHEFCQGVIQWSSPKDKVNLNTSSVMLIVIMHDVAFYIVLMEINIP